MKQIINRLMFVALVSLSLAACKREETDFGGGNGGSSVSTGYIDMSGSRLSVEFRHEDVDHPTVHSRAAAGETDTDNFMVEIVDAATDLTVNSFRYGERSRTPIEVPVGSYYLKVYSGETPEAAWHGENGSPTYGTVTSRENPYKVTKANTVDRPVAIGTVECRLLSVEVSLSFEQGMAVVISDDTECEVSLGGPSLKYTKDTPYGIVTLEDDNTLVNTITDARIGYLKPAEGVENPLDVYITTVIRGQQFNRQRMRIADNAKAGEFRKVTLRLEPVTDGVVIISAMVETWVYDEQVTVDVVRSVMLTEERIPSGGKNAPTIELPDGWSDGGVTEVSTADYDAAGDYRKPCTVNIAAKNAVESFRVTAGSENGEFARFLAANGLDSSVDMCGTGQDNARMMLTLWGFPASGFDDGELSFSLAGLMKTLSYYTGLHTFTIVVTDTTGAESTFVLTFNVTSATAADPSIVWVGNDIDKRHTVTDDLQVQIEITASKGIRSLQVVISGSLGAKDLYSIGLADQFDLIDPEATREGLSDKLKGLKFPVGDEVKDSKRVSFDISEFMTLLDTFKGDTDFQMTVTDNEGRSETKTLMLHVD